MSIFLTLLLLVQDIEAADPVTGELPVDPYEQSNDNAGADPFKNGKMAEAFHGREGIKRVSDGLVDRIIVDPRIDEIFKGQDILRLRRTLFEQFCFILNAGCDYTGRDMKAAHRDMGLQRADLNALVEILQQVMDNEQISFRNQNRFLSKLAPMDRDVVER